MLIITDSAIRPAVTNCSKKEMRTNFWFYLKCPTKFKKTEASPTRKNQQTVNPSGAFIDKGIAKRNIQKNLVLRSVTKFVQALARLAF